MDKKQMKELKFTGVIKHKLSSGRDITDEYVSHVDIDFILDTPQTFQIFNKTYTIDRIKMMTMYWDELIFRLASKDTVYEEFEVSKIFIHKILDMLPSLQTEGGVLAGWSFDEEVFDILSNEDRNFAINHYPKKTSDKLETLLETL